MWAAAAAAALVAPGLALSSASADTGTAELISDIRTGKNRGSRPDDIVAVGTSVFFTANDGQHGRELWKSNGTAAGTMMVKNINSDEYYDYGSYPADLTRIGNAVYFTADNGTHGTALWRSNGTAAGTVMLKAVDDIDDLTAVGSTLYFTADDGVHGTELWKSNGTVASTVMVKDINPDTSSGYYDHLSQLTAVGTTLYFAADDGVHGDELWKSNGTAAGTVMVKDVDPAPADEYGSEPSHFTAVGTNLYFTADNGTIGRELWKSDGTAAGTVVVKDIVSGIDNGSYPTQLTKLGSQVYFSVHGDLWKSNGTVSGTVRVKDIPSGGAFPYSYGPRDLTAVGSQLFFTVQYGEADHEQLWKSNGSASGTVVLKEVPVDNYHYYGFIDLTSSGGKLYFAVNDEAHGAELWESTGTAAGTVLAADIRPGAWGSYPESLTDVGGTLFLTAYEATHGRELWRFPALP